MNLGITISNVLFFFKRAQECTSLVLMRWNNDCNLPDIGKFNFQINYWKVISNNGSKKEEVCFVYNFVKTAGTWTCPAGNVCFSAFFLQILTN